MTLPCTANIEEYQSSSRYMCLRYPYDSILCSPFHVFPIINHPEVQTGSANHVHMVGLLLDVAHYGVKNYLKANRLSQSTSKPWNKPRAAASNGSWSGVPRTTTPCDPRLFLRLRDDAQKNTTTWRNHKLRLFKRSCTKKIHQISSNTCNLGLRPFFPCHCSIYIYNPH